MTDLKNEDFTTGIVLLIRYKILSIPEHILSLLAFVTKGKLHVFLCFAFSLCLCFHCSFVSVTSLDSKMSSNFNDTHFFLRYAI